MYFKGILIDFGGTLVYIDEKHYKKYAEGLLSIVKRYGHRNNLDNFITVLDKAYFISSKGEVKDSSQFWKLLLKELGMAKELALIGELEKFRSNQFAALFRLYDGVIPILSTLQKKYKLALVSNCAVGLSDVLKTLGLVSFFESIILSYEVDVRKPDKRIYLEALQSIRLEPNECVFVSDEISDLEGAKEVGLKTILVRQGRHTTHEAKDPNFKADFQCNHISEITNFL